MINKITNYWNGDYVLSSSDMIAVKAGIKKVTRIECASFGDFKDIKKSLDKHKLKYVFSDGKVFEKYNVYIALKDEYAKKAKEVDPTYKIFIDKLSFNDSLEYVKKFSELLNYPDCCVKSYIDNVLNQVPIQDIKIIKKLPAEINFYLNNVLNGFSNYYLSFHLPCSYNCKNNDKYQKDIYNAVKSANPDFAVKLKQTLTNPFLLFFKKNKNNAYATWDQRQGVILNGSVNGNVVNYNKYFFLKTNYPEFREKKIDQNEIKMIIDMILRGDKIEVFKNSLIIYKDNSFLRRIVSDNYIFYILNFV